MKLQKFAAALIAIMVALPTICANAQGTATAVDYKTVLADYIEATGGEEAHKAITSLKSEGTMSIPQAGIEGSVTSSQLNDKALMKIELGGLGTQTVGYDGETAWQISEMTGPEIIEGEQRDQMVRQMAISPFLSIEDKYDTIECTGTEEFNGEDCHVVVMTKEDQEPVYSYFSVESHLLVGSKMTQAGPMGSMEIVSKIGDYKDVAGVKMSHSTSVELPQGMSMVTEMESIEANVEFEDAVFELPEEIAELKDDE